MKTPDRGPECASGHEGDHGHGPASISGREVAVAENAREEPPPGPVIASGEVWIVNGHLPDCAYMRSLDETNFGVEAECDCEPEYALWDEDEELW